MVSFCSWLSSRVRPNRSIAFSAASAQEAKGATEAQLQARIKEIVEAQIEEQSLPFFLSGMLYDDGVIDPRDTRTILGICLSAINTRPVKGAEGYGVFRL